MRQPNRRELLGGERGFTLIELLVVVLIIGILAAIAIPQYFKVVERGRLSEAQTMISQLKQAQERYMARNGNYVTTATDLVNLDIIFAGSSPNFGMRNFTLAMAASGGACSPNYLITVTRGIANAGVSARYGQYAVSYDYCTGLLAYNNAFANSDFAQ